MALLRSFLKAGFPAVAHQMPLHTISTLFGDGLQLRGKGDQLLEMGLFTSPAWYSSDRGRDSFSHLQSLS